MAMSTFAICIALTYLVTQSFAQDWNSDYPFDPIGVPASNYTEPQCKSFYTQANATGTYTIQDEFAVEFADVSWTVAVNQPGAKGINTTESLIYLGSPPGEISVTGASHLAPVLSFSLYRIISFDVAKVTRGTVMLRSVRLVSLP